jgi:hypothetical protein
MPILIDELIVEAEPPRSPPPPPQAGAASAAQAPEAKISQGDRMLELSVVSDRHRRLQVD